MEHTKGVSKMSPQITEDPEDVMNLWLSVAAGKQSSTISLSY